MHPYYFLKYLSFVLCTIAHAEKVYFILSSACRGIARQPVTLSSRLRVNGLKQLVLYLPRFRAWSFSIHAGVQYARRTDSNRCLFGFIYCHTSAFLRLDFYLELVLSCRDLCARYRFSLAIFS